MTHPDATRLTPAATPLPRRRRNLLWAINWPFARLAAMLSRPHFLQFDAFAIWFYVFCLVGFVTLTALHLHGSGINIYRAAYRYTTAGEDTLFSTPVPSAASNAYIATKAGADGWFPQYRATRVDEWNYHTPAILNQLFRDQTLRIEDGAEGPGRAALLANVPSDHFTEWFRPQFWPFHFLGVETAFAAYWQAKALLLLTGTFTLFLLLTGGASRLSALGALWFYFSSFVQWAYSWPSLLPELIGLFGWIMCLNFYLLVGRRPLVLGLAALASAVGMIDFALCAYPPHQIPLVFTGAVLTLGWVWTYHARIFTPRAALARTLALAFGFGLTGVVLYYFFVDAQPVLTAAANTFYPGQRVSHGGGSSRACTSTTSWTTTTPRVRCRPPWATCANARVFCGSRR